MIQVMDQRGCRDAVLIGRVVPCECDSQWGEAINDVCAVVDLRVECNFS